MRKHIPVHFYNLIITGHNSIEEVFAGKCLEGFVPGKFSLKSRLKYDDEERARLLNTSCS